MVNWELIKVLGEGSYGVVFLAKPTSTESPLNYFAVKTAPLQYYSSLSKEKQILKHFFKCPEIIQCLGSEITIETESTSPESDHAGFYNLKLEYAAGGTLSNLIKQQNKLPETQVKEYLKMILKGLSCIHRKGFVHVDLKPDNILAFPQSNGKMKLKIADFGLSRRCGEKDGGAGYCCLPTFKGTARYMSPESIVFSEFNCALDIWSLGCVLVEMVSGESVWNNCVNGKDFILKLVRDREIPRVPEELSEEGRDFLGKCFDQNPKRRWTADMLLKHSYLQTKIVRSTKVPGVPKFPKELHLPSLQCKLRSYCVQT